MKQILKKHSYKMEKLNVFEKQTLKSLLSERTSNGMSRFYLVIDRQQASFFTQNHLLKK